ncbi:MAG: DUF4900 domain-containing protein [Candidatus Eisenbacteria bacterium]
MSTYWGFLRKRRVRSTSRRALVMGPFVLSIRGSALVGVMAVITAVLLVGIAIFILGHSEGDIVEYAVDDSRAFYIAEGGLERARGYLAELEADSPGADPVGTKFEDQPLGGGVYTVEVVANVGDEWMDAYEVVSTGTIDGVDRQVKSVIIAETFARYQWFVEYGGWKWFHTGERFEGPVHVNRQLQIDGDPWFGGPVTAGRGITMKQGSNPIFEDGYELYVEGISLPTEPELEDRIKVAAVAGGIYLPSLSGHDVYYQIELGQPSVGEMTVQGFDAHHGPIELTLPTVYDLSVGNGAAWSEERITIEGVLDGRLTIAVEGDIDVMGDILYDASTPGSGPDPGCDDVLGLITTDDIIIKYTAPNMDDCEVHGVMMSLHKNFEAEGYMHYPPRGDMIIYGGILVDQSIHLATYANDVLRSGYYRDYHYDSRLLVLPPPFFPLTGKYRVVNWEEVSPPVVES